MLDCTLCIKLSYLLSYSVNKVEMKWNVGFLNYSMYTKQLSVMFQNNLNLLWKLKINSLFLNNFYQSLNMFSIRKVSCYNAIYRWHQLTPKLWLK